jgi:ATP-dependent exoDNAse (exonuclease V) alpha subunit
MKAVIIDITANDGTITFAVKPDRVLTELDCDGINLVWVGDGIVQFVVVDRDTSDEDDDSTTSLVPFQIAYAVSIHKAQGLEYGSVKIVVTDSNEGDITHSILYTAVTRARQNLVIYWSPETELAVLSNLKMRSAAKDVALLMARRGLRRLTA